MEQTSNMHQSRTNILKEEFSKVAENKVGLSHINLELEERANYLLSEFERLKETKKFFSFLKPQNDRLYINIFISLDKNSFSSDEQINSYKIFCIVSLLLRYLHLEQMKPKV